MSEALPNHSLKITSMSVPDVVKVLAKTGGRPVTEEMVRKDIAAGAPVNVDGTINMIHYAAWLAAKGAANGD